MGFEKGIPLFSQIIQHSNKNFFPFSPVSASRACLLLTVGSQTPLWFGNIVTILVFITMCGRGATGIEWVEGRDAVKHPTM